MKFKSNRLLFGAIAVLAFLSCTEDNNDETQKPSSLISIVENVSKSGAFSVEILAKDTLFEGYNKIYLKINELDTEERINEAKLSLHPLMHMMQKVHAAPVENPDILVNGNGYFEGVVVFIMPSNPDEGWTLKVAMEVSGIVDTAVFDIPVVKSLDEAKKINIISAIDETVYFLSLVEPVEPSVGVNDLEFAVHYKQSMMSFPPAEDLVIEIEPEMPSMDHGSPNNVNPEHTANGHYNGQVNFTMTGWWRVHISIKKGDQIVTNEAFLDITF